MQQRTLFLIALIFALTGFSAYATIPATPSIAQAAPTHTSGAHKHKKKGKKHHKKKSGKTGISRRTAAQ